jgi:hypothetical protein
VSAAADLTRGWKLHWDSVPVAWPDNISRAYEAQFGRWPDHDHFRRHATFSVKPPGWVDPGRAPDAWIVFGGAAFPSIWRDGELLPTALVTRQTIRSGRPLRRAARRRAEA